MAYSRPTLLVNGVDYTDYVVPESINLLSVMQNGQLTTLDFTLKNVPGGYAVEGGKTVAFYLPGDDDPTFFGIQTRTFPGHYAASSWQYSIRCTSYEQVFGFKQLFTALRGLTFEGAVNQILQDPEQAYPTNLLTSVLNSNGALAGDMPFYAINGAFPAEVFNIISNLTSTCWRVIRVGTDLQVEFFKPFDTYNGFTLTQNNHAFRWDRFEPSINLESVINSQSVRGSQALLDTEEQAFFRGDDLTSKFDLPTTPFNNEASVVVFDSFNTQPIQTSFWFESDITGNYVYADGDGFVQYEPPGGNTNWIGLISKGLSYRVNAPLMVVDITWAGDGVAMFGLTTQNSVPAQAEAFLESGVYIDATGQVFGVSAGAILGNSGINLVPDTQYRFRFLLKRDGGCVIAMQSGDTIYSRTWPTLFETDTGTATALGSAAMTLTGGFALASVKTTYPYLGIKLEVDRGSGFFEETVGIGDIDEDVDAVLIDESVIAFFGSDPGPSTIPPKPDWQTDPDYQNIRVTYHRGVDIFATATDPVLIAAMASLVGNGDSGIREGALIIDESISTYQAALARGQTEILNQGNIVEQIVAETSRNTLVAAGVPLPRCGELTRFDITLSGTGYSLARDIPIRQWTMRAKSGANDFALAVQAGYLKRGLRSVLAELVSAGKIISINENQVIYRGASAADTLTTSDAATVIGTGNTRRWGDSRTQKTFTVNTGTDILTTAAALFVTGDDVQVKTTGTLPLPLLVDTVYYVNRSSSTTFTLYDTQAHALAGGATGKVDITTAGTGTHTLMFNAWRWMRHKWGSFAKDVELKGRGSLQAIGRLL
jgi:hypothetical protein